MSKKGILLIVSGPSGCGKGTVIGQLMKTQENVSISVSATTRKPRPGEVDGVNYHFMDKAEFESLNRSGGMLEYAEYCENYYGTPKEMVEKKCSEGVDVILEIELLGARQVKEKCPDAVSIFIMPPSMEELKRRLTDRNTEDEETIKRRLTRAQEEVKYKHEYDYIIINDIVEEAANDLAAVIRAEKLKAKYSD